MRSPPDLPGGFSFSADRPSDTWPNSHTWPFSPYHRAHFQADRFEPFQRTYRAQLTNSPPLVHSFDQTACGLSPIHGLHVNLDLCPPYPFSALRVPFPSSVISVFSVRAPHALRVRCALCLGEATPRSAMALRGGTVGGAGLCEVWGGQNLRALRV